MRIEQALQRVGITVVKADKQKNGNVVLMLRLGAGRGPMWTRIVEEFLLAQKPGWSTDVSKSFFATEGVVRYLWRIVLMGDTALAFEALSGAVIRSMAETVEVTSKPLVGRIDYPVDPKNGKMKGGHDSGTAARLRAVGLGGG